MGDVIGVIIPYFQREPGLLRRSLLSIWAQERRPKLRIIVVDDQSPQPAEAELNDLPQELLASVTVHRQANSGPGAARNLGLERMPDEVETIAFLDSDDAWAVHHLSGIQAAMEAGADFYFADYQREQSDLSQFAKCGYEPDGPVLPCPDGALRWCDPAKLSQAVIVRSPIGTPSVALRRSAFGDIRFRTELRTFGEDIVFWLEALARAPRVAASPAVSVRCGRGVNIAEHGVWGDDRALRTIVDQLKFHAYLARNFASTPAAKAHVKALNRSLELDFVAASLAMCRRLKCPPLDVVAAGLSVSPTAALRWPSALRRRARQGA